MRRAVASTALTTNVVVVVACTFTAYEGFDPGASKASSHANDDGDGLDDMMMMRQATSDKRQQMATS